MLTITKVKDILFTSASSYIALFQNLLTHKPLSPEISNQIVVLNTAIGTQNLGDEVIMHFSKEFFKEVFPEIKFVDIASHLPATPAQIEQMKAARAVIVCGTNFLSPVLEYKSPWYYHQEMRYIPNLVLMAVGWGKYSRPTPYAKFIYKKLLKNSFLHSVRDSYTLKQLNDIGVHNVVNTNCITLWSLNEIKDQINIKKSENVVFAITGYYKNAKLDRFIIKTLKSEYKQVFFWPQQGYSDLEYLQSIVDLSDITILDATLDAYKSCLLNENVDYVGTRLHGGIFAMHHKVRSIIIAVDNRAREIGRDVGLSILNQTEVERLLKKMIYEEKAVTLNLNKTEIQEWKLHLQRKLLQ